ncbi:MAG: FAD:protein FMN transferase [Salinivirgaceae bacterium]|nr:FAD:protein FMN transferase [Salinivirgaceae bacterium]
MKKQNILLIIVSLFLFSCSNQSEYIKNQGFIFGTSYSFIYEHPSGKNIQDDILAELKVFNNSLSNYDPNSIISRINNNDREVTCDTYFEQCFLRSQEIAAITNGAFDITVAPVVNAWGFGFDESTHADSAKIDSLMLFVGYHKIRLENHKIIKEIQGIKLDVSAIAKGFGVDVAAKVIEAHGVNNYMVEIGGEVRARGKNAKGKYWRIGIDKPIEDKELSNRELQEVVGLKNKSLATSGNYRQYYEKAGVKYSHTINPKTGFPARSNLLSASVLADDCMTADAFATAFMVMGLEKSIELSEKLDFIDVYLIYSDSSQEFNTYASNNFKRAITPQ